LSRVFAISTLSD